MTKQKIVTGEEWQLSVTKSPGKHMDFAKGEQGQKQLYICSFLSFTTCFLLCVFSCE
jgi:hypothetical protein